VADSAEEILNGPDYFFCEKYKSWMSKRACVKRQNKDHQVYSSFVETFPINMSLARCEGCEQGMAIKQMTEDGRQMTEKGKQSAVDYRVNKEGMVIEEVEKKDGGKGLICPICTERPQLIRKNGKSQGRCRECHGAQTAANWERIRRERASREKECGEKVGSGEGGKKQKTEGRGQRMEEGTELLILDFDEHQGVYEALKKMAEEDIRTIEGQAIYLIRTGVQLCERLDERGAS